MAFLTKEDLTGNKMQGFISGLQDVGNSLLNDTPPTWAGESAQNIAEMNDANAYRKQLAAVVQGLMDPTDTALKLGSSGGEITYGDGHSEKFPAGSPNAVQEMLNRLLDPKAIGGVAPTYGRPVATPGGGQMMPAGAGGNPMAGLMGGGADIMKLFGQGGGGGGGEVGAPSSFGVQYDPNALKGLGPQGF